MINFHYRHEKCIIKPSRTECGFLRSSLLISGSISEGRLKCLSQKSRDLSVTPSFHNERYLRSKPQV